MSRWLSADPALSDYIPGALINDEVRKRNQNLPGMGGVFNTVNMHLYHYAGNNPVKYTDPTGREDEIFISAASNTTTTTGNEGYVESAYYSPAGPEVNGVKMVFAEATLDTTNGSDLSAGVGVFSMEGEVGDNLSLNGNLDVLTAEGQIAFTNGGAALSLGASAISIGLGAGAEVDAFGREFGINVSGSIGIEAGFEVSFDAFSGFVFDISAILGVKIELGWGKKEE